VASDRAALDGAVLEALEPPLNGPRRFWLGFLFVDDPWLASRARGIADEVVRRRGRVLDAHGARGGEAVLALAREVARRECTESPVWLDWSGVPSSAVDRRSVDDALTVMNAARTRLIAALRGGLVVVSPSWAEQACVRRAADLWFGREFALRLRPETAQAPGASEDRADARAQVELWRRIAPIAVMRALREDDAAAGQRVADELAGAASPRDAVRLETVAAGVALERGEREAAAAQALAVIASQPAEPDVLAAAIEIAATATTDRAAVEQLWRRAVDAMLERRGDDDVDALTSMNNLAVTLHDQGDLGRARALYERVLDVREQVLGEEHPATLTSMNNLAAALRGRGELADARALHERVLDVRERVLGEEHPATLTSMNNLALTLHDQGHAAGARALQERVLGVQGRVLGAEHPATLTSMNNLAETLRRQGDAAGARVLLEHVLDVKQRVLGEEHPDTLKSMSNLALTSSGQGDVAGARALQERASDALGRVLGTEHPATLTSISNLALTLRDQGDLVRARELHERVLDARRRVLGDEHPDTVRSMKNLAALREDGDGAG
jgi:tetratricopeptide (TPR) repeat protein